MGRMTSIPGCNPLLQIQFLFVTALLKFYLYDKVTSRHTGVPLMYADTTLASLREELSIIPYEAALVKLHKTPVALRFLACSATNWLASTCSLVDIVATCLTSRFAIMLVLITNQG